MDRSRFYDISPYFGEEVEKAKERMLEKKEYIWAFSTLLSFRDILSIRTISNQIINALEGVHSYEDFQKNITAGILIPTILKNSTTGFTVSGGDEIESDKGYLFISNHRDIILDCTLLDYALLQKGKPMCEMAVGDNLMANKFVEDLFRLNGGIIVKRNLPMREKYLESLRLSEYFVERVIDDKKSIWVAEKSGRSKDGNDFAQSAIIKMLYLSKRKSGINFNELINKCRIVPVAISYEYDPNDINKGREEVNKSLNDGVYEKKKYEDLISMVKGLRQEKGNVHISIGKPLEGEYNTPEEVAKEIDRAILTNYHLFDTNYLAYDVTYNTDKYKSMYKKETKEEFLLRLNHLNDDVKNYVLNIYANPVKNREKYEEG